MDRWSIIQLVVTNQTISLSRTSPYHVATPALKKWATGRYVIIDLGSANGCHVEHGGDWQQFAEAEVGATESLLLGEFPTNARDLIRRLSKPRPPGVTVMAAADETHRSRDEVAPPTGTGNAPAVTHDSLSAVWSRLPEYQKIAAIVATSVLGLLIIAAITIGFLGGL